MHTRLKHRRHQPKRKKMTSVHTSSVIYSNKGTRIQQSDWMVGLQVANKTTTGALQPHTRNKTDMKSWQSVNVSCAIKFQALHTCLTNLVRTGIKKKSQYNFLAEIKVFICYTELLRKLSSFSVLWLQWIKKFCGHNPAAVFLIRPKENL